MSFNVSADAYDRFMGSWSRLLAPQLADLAGICPGQRAIDVGCGPGALTAKLVSRLGADAVAAADPSESFVAAARERHPGVDVRQASAEALPFPDDRFDAALAQLVVHFMTNPVAGLHEMARVVRARGVVVTCVWDYAGARGALGPFWKAARELDPDAVDESKLAGARPGHLTELMEAAGLGESRRSSFRSAATSRASTTGGSRSPEASGRQALTSASWSPIDGPSCASGAGRCCPAVRSRSRRSRGPPGASRRHSHAMVGTSSRKWLLNGPLPLRRAPWRHRR